MGTLWGLLLELRGSLRTKKFWAIVVILAILYVPWIYILKRMAVGGEVLNQKVIISGLLSFAEGSGIIMLSILALLLGASAINSEIEKGTLKIVMSQPLRRIEYLLGKFLAHTVTIGIALGFSVLFLFVGFLYIGVPLSKGLVGDVLLLTILLLLTMVQLLAIGYLLSTLIRSPGTSLGLSLLVFFLIIFVIPGLVTFFAFTHSSSSSTNGKLVGPSQLENEYRTKYLFFDPIAQIKVTTSDMTKTIYVQKRITAVFNQSVSPVYVNGSVMGIPLKGEGTQHLVKPLNAKVLVKKVHYCSYSGESSSTYRNGLYFYNITECMPEEIYEGLLYSISVHKINVALLFAMTLIYFGAAVLLFQRKELR